MRRVKSKNTSPELKVRSLLQALNFKGYRLHREEIPGKPDICWIGKKKVIFIHGCFWHGHNCRRGDRQPKSNIEYWNRKIGRNILRDKENQEKLRSQGWDFIIIWECELRDTIKVTEKIQSFLL